jgi:hypothetical protein
LLLPEQQHIVPVPRGFDRVDLHAGDVGEIYAPDFGANGPKGKNFEVKCN